MLHLKCLFAFINFIFHLMPKYIFTIAAKKVVFNSKLNRDCKVVFRTNYTLQLKEEINERRRGRRRILKKEGAPSAVMRIR